MRTEFVRPASEPQEFVAQLNGQWLEFTGPTRLVTSIGWQIVSDHIAAGDGLARAEQQDFAWEPLVAELSSDGTLMLRVLDSTSPTPLAVRPPWALLATMGAALTVSSERIGIRPPAGYVYANDETMARWRSMPITDEMLQVLSYTDIDWMQPLEFLWPWDERPDLDNDQLTVLGAELIGAVIAKGLIAYGTIEDTFVPAPMAPEQQIEHVLTQWMALSVGNIEPGAIGWFYRTEYGADVLSNHRASLPEG